MNKQEKINFVRVLSERIAENMVAQIEAGSIPENWDGHELRTLLFRNHRDSADMSINSMAGKRLKNFRNTVIINNL